MNTPMRTAVCFPSAETLARSFDVQLLADVGAAAAEQCIEDRREVCAVPAVFCADAARNAAFQAAFVRGVHSRGVTAQGDRPVSPLPPRDPDFFPGAAHHLARKAARESAVLLKNAGLLPLKSKGTIAFIGEPAIQPRLIAEAEPFDVDPALMSVRSVAKAEYAKGFAADDVQIHEALFDEALALAARSDVCVLFAETTGERLPLPQERLICAIAAVCRSVAVVLHCDNVVTMPWLEQVQAVLLMGRGGEACGAAAVDLLFGGVSPSGRLTAAFPPFAAEHGLGYCPITTTADPAARSVRVQNNGRMGMKAVVFSPDPQNHAVFEKVYVSPHAEHLVTF